MRLLGYLLVLVAIGAAFAAGWESRGDTRDRPGRAAKPSSTLARSAPLVRRSAPQAPEPAGCTRGPAGCTSREAPAHGRRVPHHEPGGHLCRWDGNSATILAYPPVEMYSLSGTYETVYWSADVYRRVRRKWRPYITQMPWLSRVTDRDGTLNRYDGSTWMRFTGGSGGYAVLFWSFVDLRTPGTYRVKEFYGWKNGTVHPQWGVFSRNDPPGAGCRF